MAADDGRDGRQDHFACIELGTPRTTLAAFPHGVDGADSYVDDSNGTRVVYYSRVNCAARQADIYKVIDK